jgi:23S rRNA (uracil1939-C5)-methyltransferase
LRVRLTERKPGWGRGEIAEILTPGPDRRPAPCAYFDRCGGCDLQHLDEATQLRLKAETVVETLSRLGGVKAPASLKIIAGAPWAYRLRAQFQIGMTDRGIGVGYFARGSNQLVPVASCPILVPELEAALETLPQTLQGQELKRLDATAGDQGLSFAPPVGELPHGEVSTEIGGLTYWYDARCFFQGHRQATAALIEEAVGAASDPDGEAFDLFSGVGLFSLPLAKRYRRVVGVESDRIAVRYARRNAKENALANLETLAISIDSFIEELPEAAARVLVDPPRVGLSPKVRRTLLERRPLHLTYVSCHAPTLARDLKSLLVAYRLEDLTLVDLFPQTGHMEVVAQLFLRDEERDLDALGGADDGARTEDFE